ncbi:noncanonical pyrimidine nucleotidase, YjjG family [Flavobacteriaceae bacterium TP-CH-4]|uniref:Noncanonical pyrimidine nucleotidase, YjjG family n=1 Tax=Pelagihabitans pacificus TaxID=2696054 RepID=A0A967AX82_9FLAO|nr:YjjG family noncanonical pyrimidine nucleotidase [Pelagihabitans pacificus]NHF58256.1 noncanonical pyrimidine nucleotidase, YjjG family [Pelagihabitans pacificus]
MFRELVTDVFFDLDHTLWDFEKNSALTFEKILDEHRVGVDLHDFLKVYVPANLAFWKLYREEKISKEELRYQRLKSVFDTLGHPISDDTINLLAEAYIKLLSTQTHLFPNTLEILEYLKPKYRLHIITNGFQEIQDKKLKNSNIYSYFEHVVNSEMAGVKKPNPYIFELALARANTSGERSLMIGDSLEADIQGAMAVGLHALHFDPHEGPKHDFCDMIHDLHEIKTYL